MRFHVPVVAPKFIDWLEYFSALGVGGDGKPGIAAITLAPFVFSWEKMDEEMETHEAIHVYQQLEMGLIGSLVAVPAVGLAVGLTGHAWWVTLLACLGTGLFGFLPFLGWFYWLYGIFYLHWLLKSRNVEYKVRLADGSKRELTDGEKAYLLIPYEREAYLWDQEGLAYLQRRKFFGWARIAKWELEKPGAELPEHLFSAVTFRKQ